MKKTIAILLVLVIGMVGVWAGTFDSYTNNGSADLELTTSVAHRYGLKIGTRAVTGANLGALVTDFLTFPVANTVTSVPFTEDELSEVLYVNYMNNSKGSTTISTTMSPMFSSSTDTKIGYSVTIDGQAAVVVPSVLSTVSTPVYEDDGITPVLDPETNEPVVVVSDVPIGITFINESATSNGMRVASKKFTIAMDQTAWLAAAAAADYSVTWVINLTSNN